MRGLLKDRTMRKRFSSYQIFTNRAFNKDLLETQLGIMATDLFERPEAYDLKSAINYLKDISPGQRTLLSEVSTIASLILVLPATNAVSERSFSSLHRLKSYLRSTMTQERLNSVVTLHVQKELTDQLDLVETCTVTGNEFVGSSEHLLNCYVWKVLFSR